MATVLITDDARPGNERDVVMVCDSCSWSKSSRSTDSLGKAEIHLRHEHVTGIITYKDQIRMV